MRSLIRSAAYLADERIEVNGRPVLCTVVQAKGELPRVAGTTRRIAATFTFWIDKKDEVIWKETDHRDGPLLPEAPRIEYTMDRTEWYKASDPDAQSAPEELFVLRPSEPVELAKQFANPAEENERELQGRQAPAVKLGTKEGQVVSLATFQGNPVLLDFWATWCAPCVESLSAVEKLYSETAGNGLVLLSIDEDEDVETVTNFLAKRKQPWPNYHLTEEIADAFPPHGIPYFVLLDASGKVVYSKAGVDDTGLRAAVAKLGPEFARVSETSHPFGKTLSVAIQGSFFHSFLLPRKPTHQMEGLAPFNVALSTSGRISEAGDPVIVSSWYQLDSRCFFACLSLCSSPGKRLPTKPPPCKSPPCQ